MDSRIYAGFCDEVEKIAAAKAKGRAPFLLHLRIAAIKNGDFRRVAYTGKEAQWTLMSIPVGGEVGDEVHKATEQTFFCARGRGTATLNGRSKPFAEGDVLIVPFGNQHNIKNTGKSSLKLFTSYYPPHHIPGTIHHTKADADADVEDEAFGKKAEKKA